MRQPLLFLHLALALATAPALPVDPKDKLPDLAAQTQFGPLVQDGLNLTVDGHTWKASGEIRSDHSVFLIWITWDGRIATAVYHLNDKGNLVGHWGWAGEVVLEEDGTLTGEHLREETLWRSPKAVPPRPAILK